MHKESTHNTVDEESTHIVIDEEPTPKAVDEERTRVAVDEETINVEVVESSKMLEGNLPSSNWVEEIAGGDYSCNNADMVVPHVEESQMRVATLPMEEISMSGFFMFCGAASLHIPLRLNCFGSFYFAGTNAGLYAQELINNCGKIVVDSKSTLITNPVQVLDKAAMETKSLGSSTALVAYFDGQEIAELLAASAQEVGQSSSIRSPFADAAQAAGYVGYTGGKLDDVTVILSLVQKRSTSTVQ
ncbi:hypothetical protein GH714_000177 [Hevea brasiliensis]|uniref:Protein phosphatase n=1 Tax=Hevea brasiliensis TaxID=3981 RepID=A0A6A6M923_HEVBR|nr:hypothetical protein GH714_000177 [Hevea brasiliensis]